GCVTGSVKDGTPLSWEAGAAPLRNDGGGVPSSTNDGGGPTLVSSKSEFRRAGVGAGQAFSSSPTSGTAPYDGGGYGSSRSYRRSPRRPPAGPAAGAAARLRWSRNAATAASRAIANGPAMNSASTRSTP